MAIFVDTFTDTDAVQLQSHTPDTGTSWTRLWSDAPGLDAVITSNQLSVESNADDGIVYTADGTYPTANYKITVTRVAHTATGVRPTYWILRLQDIDNFYAVRFDDAGAGQAQIYKKVAGSFSTIGSAFVGPAAGSVVEISINGDTITVVDDSVTIATETDTDISAAGKAGVGFGGGTELVTSTDDANAGNQWDDLTIEDLGAGAVKDVIMSGIIPFAR